MDVIRQMQVTQQLTFQQLQALSNELLWQVGWYYHLHHLHHLLTLLLRHQWMKGLGGIKVPGLAGSAGRSHI